MNLVSKARKTQVYSFNFIFLFLISADFAINLSLTLEVTSVIFVCTRASNLSNVSNVTVNSQGLIAIRITQGFILENDPTNVTNVKRSSTT